QALPCIRFGNVAPEGAQAHPGILSDLLRRRAKLFTRLPGCTCFVCRLAEADVQPCQFHAKQWNKTQEISWEDDHLIRTDDLVVNRLVFRLERQYVWVFFQGGSFLL